ncbi:LA_2219 family laminin/E-cadherin/plasminogen-binding protein [Leptospira sp. 'Mane']|uniref:LA_2219 family laminin/E-cadherin/plasminogen-binding protein n=1 Tax=Leptospira sp. 'Mane' TaxID=3387407 RepID=UPI00398AF1B7
MNLRFLFYVLLLVSFSSFFLCKTTTNSENANSTSAVVPVGDILPPPGGEGELIINERGETVPNSTTELPFFQKKSEMQNELFRVYLASDSYQVRQIRSTDKVLRKPDPGGDELAKEELKKFDLISFVDDGYVSVGLNTNTGKLESIAFDRRVPRINDIAKIIQNDASRWNYEHLSKDGLPVVTRFLITYQIRLFASKSRDEIKQMLQKKK